ncbi:hypothetical protein QFC22_005821 [Naganishia vaughanmartiniae]|uniref:Uncharacterized protein n=1 Tax=Naganishia vaughanmartiniae TaxID=1424756 RepID=A0ACC2WRD8_9TREE|nr:hypothetical protein QFC22_005821 [Naganishia vaughanmartiniae]
MPTPSESLTSAQSQASVFRLLTWNATIPLEITLARDSLPRNTQVDQIHAADGDEAVDGDDEEEESLPRYYMQVPRHTYLPLLIPEINEIFVSSITTSSERDEEGDGAGSKHGSGRGTDGWWFEVEWVGRKGKRQRETCKWV